MKSHWILSIVGGIFFGALFYGIYRQFALPRALITPQAQKTIKERPLEKYAILNLAKRSYQPSPIVLDNATATTSAYTTYSFHFSSDGKRVSGTANIPQTKKDEKFPVIIQFRGYVDREKYTPGEGTRKSGQVFVQNGFITLAPDFLGYGGSDKSSQDVFEERFESYTTALNLLASISTLPQADPTRIGIWGHSNGGQIALTVLEVLSKSIPTTLWAPVSKPFPFSILYYTDELTDLGKMLRKRLAKFEEDYDVDEFTLTTYLDRIVAPLQLHQGTEDTAVPKKWSDDLVKKLKDIKKDVTYFTYPGADHNLSVGWNTVVERDIEFFKKELK